MFCWNMETYWARLVCYLRHIPTWAPFSSFKKQALETRHAVEAMMDVPYELVKSEMVCIHPLFHSRREIEDS